MRKLQEAVSSAKRQFLGYEEVWEEDGSHSVYVDENLVEDPDTDETIKRTKVVRQGKRVIKFKTDKPGFRVAFVNGRPKEIKITPQELITRKKAAKKGARKSKGKKSRAAIQRKKSLRLVRK